MGIFRKNVKKEEKNELETQNIEKNSVKRGQFLKNIKVGNVDRILKLDRKLEKGQVKIADLTNDELEKIIRLRKDRIDEKARRLSSYFNG